MEPSHLPCSSLTHPAAILTPSIGVLRWIRDKTGQIGWHAWANPDNQYSLICRHTYLAGQGRGQADRCDAEEPTIYVSPLEKLRNHNLSVVDVDSEADILAAWYSGGIDSDDFCTSVG